MNNFVYHNPTKVLFGKGTISKIGAEIKEFNAKKVLMLYGMKSIFKNGVYKEVMESLNSNGIEVIEKGGIKANPILSFVLDAVGICKKENIDSILAIGGGSVIDTAKAVAAGALYEGNIWDAFEGKTSLDKSLPIFTVLTLSATASEMNAFAVITKEEENKKWAFTAGIDSYPKVTIIDPSIQTSLPKEQTVYGAVDTLSHVFELYFDGTENTNLVDEFAEGIIRTVMKNTKILLNDSSNYDARAELCWSATNALNGVIGSGRNYGDWATHTLEHSISAFYDVAHGAGLAVMFPAWMKYVYKDNPSKFAQLAENVFGIKEGTELEKAAKGIEKISQFFKAIGAPTTLNDFGITADEIEKLTENASIRLPLGRRKKLMKDDIREIYRLALV
jgi:alcohol dehydrogenase YqhD (iron-dependent ADH family)